ncbi:NepR family anti-sigma factor [Ochrobactrum vermis]|uniref:NepR family anti-sigma factor n=1 Tax=Ochrobactrum vermis TaxID=1827297 RepID=A0ABU8PFU8_9HYPH|nr:NepR family anti-sigma factor [Ochrobactrum vermis]PQZ30612.1 RNA polymerase [Ochrobactrum vermis]
MAEKENLHMNGAGVRSPRRVQKDILGPNCEVGLKLKALYTSIQDETIPDRFLDLLEKLDQAEQESMREHSTRSVG